MVKMVITSGPVDFYGTAPSMSDKHTAAPDIKQVLDGTWKENPHPGYTDRDIDLVCVNGAQFAAYVGLNPAVSPVATNPSQFAAEWNDKVHSVFEEVHYNSQGISIKVDSAEEIAALIVLGHASDNSSSWNNTPQPGMSPQPGLSLFNQGYAVSGLHQSPNGGPGFGGENMRFTPRPIDNQANRPIFTPQMRGAAILVLRGMGINISIDSDHGDRYLSGVEFPSPTDMPTLASHPMFSTVASGAIRALLSATPQYRHHELYGDGL